MDNGRKQNASPLTASTFTHDFNVDPLLDTELRRAAAPPHGKRPRERPSPEANETEVPVPPQDATSQVSRVSDLN